MVMVEPAVTGPEIVAMASGSLLPGEPEVADCEGAAGGRDWATALPARSSEAAAARRLRKRIFVAGLLGIRELGARRGANEAKERKRLEMKEEAECWNE
jgi:hypothetical protein